MSGHVYTLGIDPGVTGALVAIEGKRVFEIDDTPIFKVPTERGTSSRYNIPEMHKLIRRWKGQDVKCFIEQSQPMPEQGILATFSLGFGFGIWITCLTAEKIPFETVNASKWKKFMMSEYFKPDKHDSLEKARRLYPGAKGELARARDHNRAEAILIAHYGKHYMV